MQLLGLSDLVETSGKFRCWSDIPDSAERKEYLKQTNLLFRLNTQNILVLCEYSRELHRTLFSRPF